MIRFHNDDKTGISDPWARSVVDWLIDRLKIRRARLFFYMEGLHHEISDDGVLSEGETLNFLYDGDACCYDNGTTYAVKVSLSAAMPFPYKWTVDDGDGYLDGIFTLETPCEAFIWLCAHELRHIWQWENEPKAKQIYKLLGCNAETDADIFAARMLVEWKHQ